MNVDLILKTLNAKRVDCLLVGGMNFVLGHPTDYVTFDVDVWVRDTAANLARLNLALRAMGAQWGRTEKEWADIPHDSGWLELQDCFCLTTRHGALDIFRQVQGLEGRYPECRKASLRRRTPTGIPFRSLSDRHMLETQLSLPARERKPDRIKILRRGCAKR